LGWLISSATFLPNNCKQALDFLDDGPHALKQAMLDLNISDKKVSGTGWRRRKATFRVCEQSHRKKPCKWNTGESW
jgi:hypothetical protein